MPSTVEAPNLRAPDAAGILPAAWARSSLTSCARFSVFLSSFPLRCDSSCGRTCASSSSSCFGLHSSVAPPTQSTCSAIRVAPACRCQPQNLHFTFGTCGLFVSLRISTHLQDAPARAGIFGASWPVDRCAEARALCPQLQTHEAPARRTSQAPRRAAPPH
eukprot:1544931-Prymnesium_polylepis.1